MRHWPHLALIAVAAALIAADAKQFEPGTVPAPVEGRIIRSCGWTLFPGASHSIVGDKVTVTVRNVDGRRVATIKIQDAVRQLEAQEDPDKGVRIKLTDSSQTPARSAEYDSWDALQKAEPVAWLEYRKYQTEIEAETLPGERICNGGGQGAVISPDLPWPMIGVKGGDAEDGCAVGEVLSESPAEKAGIERGDVITRVAGYEVPSFEGLRNLVARQRIGTHVQVVARRGFETRTFDVRIGRKPVGS